jgi:hypothetical protein
LLPNVERLIAKHGTVVRLPELLAIIADRPKARSTDAKRGMRDIAGLEQLLSLRQRQELAEGQEPGFCQDVTEAQPSFDGAGQ